MMLLTGGGWFYIAQKNRLKDDAESDLSAMARLKVDQISPWRSGSTFRLPLPP
jgi:hypothetical protein